MLFNLAHAQSKLGGQLLFHVIQNEIQKKRTNEKAVVSGQLLFPVMKNERQRKRTPLKASGFPQIHFKPFTPASELKVGRRSSSSQRLAQSFQKTLMTEFLFGSSSNCLEWYESKMESQKITTRNQFEIIHILCFFMESFLLVRIETPNIGNAHELEFVESQIRLQKRRIGGRKRRRGDGGCAVCGVKKSTRANLRIFRCVVRISDRGSWIRVLVAKPFLGTEPSKLQGPPRPGLCRYGP